MADSDFILRDVECSCGYNLRGLTVGHQCPECGRAVKSALGIRHDPRSWQEMQKTHQSRAVREGVLQASIDARLPFEAAWLVLRAQRYASFRSGGADVSARQLCAALRDLARVWFEGENEAILGLARMKLRGAEDVGRAVFALVRSGLIRKLEKESMSDFDGLFRLENLFEVEL